MGLASPAAYFASGHIDLGLEELGSTAINVVTFGIGRLGKLGTDVPGMFGGLVQRAKQAEDTITVFDKPP
jgi:hypothetical protein